MKLIKLLTIIIVLSNLPTTSIISASENTGLTNTTSSNISVKDDIIDLMTIKTDLLNTEEDKASVLIILDIDDTLLEAVNFIGSDKWYTWQRGKKVYNHSGEMIKINKDQVYACMFSILGTLFDLGTFKLTQDNTADIINDLSDYNLMLLTSRTYSFRRATERELNVNGINVTKHHLVDKNKTLDFSLNDGYRTDKVTYQRGLVMSSGLDKGKVLREVLKQLGKSYQSIYFVDDSRVNIKNMTEEWKNDKTKFTMYHYTKIDKKISKEEITQSDQAKKLFEGFLKTAYADRSLTFENGSCR